MVSTLLLGDLNLLLPKTSPLYYTKTSDTLEHVTDTSEANVVAWHDNQEETQIGPIPAEKC